MTHLQKRNKQQQHRLQRQLMSQGEKCITRQFFSKEQQHFSERLFKLSMSKL